jgi:hypothetical protein
MRVRGIGFELPILQQTLGCWNGRGDTSQESHSIKQTENRRGGPLSKKEPVEPEAGPHNWLVEPIAPA